jgi:hypothetical protein
MGKNYDAYQQAQQALEQANSRVSDVSGGSTAQAYSEALTNQEQADINVEDAYTNYLENPEK